MCLLVTSVLLAGLDFSLPRESLIPKPLYLLLFVTASYWLDCRTWSVTLSVLQAQNFLQKLALDLWVMNNDCHIFFSSFNSIS